MPKIPEYYSRGTFPAESMPRIPSDAGGQVGAALARGGAQMADVGFQLEQKLQQLSQMTELSQNSIDARTKINDIHLDLLNSPDFNSNPESARAEFERRIGDLKSQYKISDPRVAAEFNNQFETAKFHALNSVVNESRKKAIDLGRGAAEIDLVKLQNLAFEAPDERAYMEISGQARGRLMGLAAVGAYKAEDAVEKFQRWESATAIGRAKRDMLIDPESTLSALAEKRGIYARINETDLTPLMDLAQKRVEHVQNQQRLAAEHQERQFQKQTVNAAYDELTTMFPSDYGRAVEYARDPRNYPGLDEERRKSLVGSLENAANWDRQKRDQNQKQTNNLVFDNFLKNPSGMNEATIIATAADPQVKQHLIDISRKNTEQRFRTDPAIEADVLGKIWSGKITNRSELLAYVGNGIGADKVKDLAGSIEQAQDPTKSRYFQMAEDVFSQKYKDDPDSLKLKSEFLYLLDQHVKRDGLKGPEVFKRAEELMKPMEENRWWKFWQSSDAVTPPFQKVIKENPPWITVEEPPATPASMPIVRPVPKTPNFGAGNIDLNNRPIVRNSDGSISTVRSISFSEDGMEILVPTITPDGKLLSDKEAVEFYHKTGQYLGKFKTIKESNAYAKKLHEDQDSQYSGPNTDYSISSDQRTAITVILKQAGYPLTEANIQAMSKKLRQGE